MDMERIVTECYFCKESYESAKLDGAHRCKTEAEKIPPNIPTFLNTIPLLRRVAGEKSYLYKT